MSLIQKEIHDKGLTAPRVTPAAVEANIASEHYFNAWDGVTGESINHDGGLTSASQPQALKCLTICVLVLKNGFMVTGESACASPENLDADVGRKLARQHAVQKIWPLMGYSLRNHLSKKSRAKQSGTKEN